MLRLKVDQKVLVALKAAVPKKDKAQERLDKYVSNLEKVVNSHIFQTRTALMFAKKLYWGSLTAIQENGGQIWSLGNIRTHKWLENNGLQLVLQTNKGQANNITGEIAIIKFTDLVEVEDDEDLLRLQAMNDADLDQFLVSVPSSDLSAYQGLLSSYYETPESRIQIDYDLLRVNTACTINYIKKLVRSKVANKDKTEYRKALRILRIAQVNGDVYPQKKRKSVFGRTYYEGVSIQTVSKDLRKAILNGCYEYDVKSSVVAWKLAFARELLAAQNTMHEVEDDFFAIYYYVIYKSEYFEDLQAKVFTEDSDLTLEQQAKVIKSAMTALSFGGKMTGRWTNNFGEEQKSSVANIFGNNYINEFSRFVNSVEVDKFQQQQKILDKHIINKFTASYLHLTTMPELQTKTGRLSNSKVLAWLYQKAETIVMDYVREELKTRNVGVKANIHDAIVVDRQLTQAEVSAIKHVVSCKTDLIYFDLGETHYNS